MPVIENSLIGKVQIYKPSKETKLAIITNALCYESVHQGIRNHIKSMTFKSQQKKHPVMCLKK
jgi:hypothetical protein